ncbi:MAG: septum site-determining protein Ssd [Mycobacteriales bacterium]|nr:hypothetical protein [Frankia sp.]
MRRPLVVTADPQLLDDLLRLAAAAGAEVDVAPDAVGARAVWAGAPAVVVGEDVADQLVAARLARRAAGVVLVGHDRDDARLWRRAVALGVQNVVTLPEAEPWLVDFLADAAEPSVGGRVVSVIGGRGGAGATTLAVALAVTAATADPVILIDADPYGGGIDLALGVEDLPGLRWPDLAESRGRIAGGDLLGALPRRNGVSVLSWDRGDVVPISVDATATVIAAARRVSALVVVDMRRAFDDVARLLLSQTDVTLLVVPAEVRACAAASRVALATDAQCRDVRVVARLPAPGRMHPSQVADALGVPLLGVFRDDPRLRRAAERGEPPLDTRRGALSVLCRRILAEVRRATSADLAA